MKNVDYNYLCSIIGDLAGIPVRVYKDKEMVFYRSTVNLPKDPILAYEDKIMAIDTHIGYFITPCFHYYGVINGEEYKIVMGPSIPAKSDEQTLRELAFKCGVSEDDTEEFLRGMNCIVPMPLDSIIQILCTMNYIMNDEKLGLKDIRIYEADQQNIKALLEQKIADMVRHGDVAALKKWIATAGAVNGGVLAKDMLRQTKNTFIVTVTLISRAAISGGMDTDDALSLSDAYIQKCELLNNLEMLMNLLYHMVLDYTERVDNLRRGSSPSKFVLDVKNYIIHHLSEQISTEDIAKALFMSRSRLSVKFKAETGENISDYILKEKTDEAKRLLKYTDKTAVAISNYLGFSSQSHFTRVFKKYVGCQPNEYRKKHTDS